MAEPETITVLVVDDEPGMLRAWKHILHDARYQVLLLASPHEALEALSSVGIDVAVVDIRMPLMDGMELLSQIKATHSEVEVVMMTGYGGVQEAVEAIKRGAYDFLSKPFESNEAAELTVRRAAERRVLERRVKHLERMEDGQIIRGLVGQSAAVRQVVDLVSSIAASQATVLICGESGTGKEVVARALHENSPRRSRPMVAVNCSALTESLLESELFGHAKGSFTGAITAHQGLFEAARGGTLLLDEIGDMPLATQVKLLRALQDGEVRPVGATRTVKADARVIAATNVDLEAHCRDGSFRQDLYYRLNVLRIDVPPLRARGEDIALLAYHFLRKHEETSGKKFDGFDAEALQQLGGYAWPGNVRELQNVIERAVILGRGRTIAASDLPAVVSGSAEAEPVGSGEAHNVVDALPFAEAKALAIEHFERRYLTHLLRRQETVAAAARVAGLDRSNFKRLLRRHGLTEKADD